MIYHDYDHYDHISGDDYTAALAIAVMTVLMIVLITALMNVIMMMLRAISECDYRT